MRHGYNGNNSIEITPIDKGHPVTSYCLGILGNVFCPTWYHESNII